MILNRTHLEHSVIAGCIQLIIFLLTGNIAVAAVFSTAIFIGREVCQAEYRYINEFNNGKREGIPIFAGIHPSVWNKTDPWLDWIFPAITTTAIALLL